MARRPDGTTTWRTAAFDRLGEDWNFVDKCAFYSAKDQGHVCRYFHDSEEMGFSPLVNAQNKLPDQRRQKRQRERDRKAQARMKGLPALPRSLTPWVRDTMPAYFFYNYQKGAKAVTGVCSACGHELVVRILKADCFYHGDTPEKQAYENARHFVRLDQNKTVPCDHYYYAHYESKWKQGNRPVMFPYQYNFEADCRGHVYCRGLPRAMPCTTVSAAMLTVWPRGSP